jgi:hypothetical protein
MKPVPKNIFRLPSVKEKEYLSSTRLEMCLAGNLLVEIILPNHMFVRDIS